MILNTTHNKNMQKAQSSSKVRHWPIKHKQVHIAVLCNANHIHVKFGVTESKHIRSKQPSGPAPVLSVTQTESWTVAEGSRLVLQVKG